MRDYGVVTDDEFENRIEQSYKLNIEFAKPNLVHNVQHKITFCTIILPAMPKSVTSKVRSLLLH